MFRKPTGVDDAATPASTTEDEYKDLAGSPYECWINTRVRRKFEGQWWVSEPIRRYRMLKLRSKTIAVFAVAYSDGDNEELSLRQASL